jgi:probable rRNA maturation factor
MSVFISFLPETLEEKFDFDLQRVKSFAENLLKVLNLENAELSLVFTDDKNIRKLNREWRNKDKPTDVLSFPQDFPPKDFNENFTPEGELKRALEDCKNCHLLGDIVISLETAQRQAEEYGWSLEEELERLILHGLVHLLGFDHETSEYAEEKFKQIEELILERLKNLNGN